MLLNNGVPFLCLGGLVVRVSDYSNQKEGLGFKLQLSCAIFSTEVLSWNCNVRYGMLIWHTICFKITAIG